MRQPLIKCHDENGVIAKQRGSTRLYLKLTPEDTAIQVRRYKRATTRYALKSVGYLVGWGYESDYLDSLSMSDYERWKAYWLTRQSS